MEHNDFDRLRQSLKDAVDLENSGRSPAFRTTKYTGPIKIEVRDNGKIVWSLQKQLNTLKNLDIRGCEAYSDAVRAMAEHLGQGDKGMAALMDIPVSTYRTWKQGRREFSAPSRRLFEITIQYPDVMRDVIRRSEKLYV